MSEGESYIINFVPSVGSLNLGDYIISEAINSVLEDLFRNDNVFIINLSSHQPTHCTHWGYMKKLRKNGRIVTILSGANPVHSFYLPFSKINQWAVGPADIPFISNVILFGTGTILMKHTNNPIKKLARGIIWTYSSKFWRAVLNREFPHAVRDKETVELLHNLGLEAKNLGCPTLWSLDAIVKRIPKSKSDAAVTTLTYYKAGPEDIELMKMLLEMYDEVYIWPQDPMDVIYIKKISNRVQGQLKIIPPRLKKYDEFLKGHAIDYVGTRVHAGIRALQKGKRTIIIAVDHRAISFARDFGIPAVSRSSISTSLPSVIESKFKVKITVPRKSIKSYLKAFRSYVLSK